MNEAHLASDIVISKLYERQMPIFYHAETPAIDVNIERVVSERLSSLFT
jgi:hypothetical protein